MDHVTGSQHGELHNMPILRFREIMHHNSFMGKIPVPKKTYGSQCIPSHFSRKNI